MVIRDGVVLKVRLWKAVVRHNSFHNVEGFQEVVVLRDQRWIEGRLYRRVPAGACTSLTVRGLEADAQ